MKKYTIYRVNLDDLTASVWKELVASEEEVKLEIKKLAGYVRKHDHPSSFVYREDIPRDRLVIPVL